MPNTYFQFKQFTVHQENVAMKVCTDACLFGAWVADKLEQKQVSANDILDIGTGTGLLSLMLAQKTAARFDAIEIENAAAEQAIRNFSQSNWSNRMQVIEGDVEKVALNKKYDLIISNPPFFENDLLSPDKKRNLALHGTQLDFTGLIHVIKHHLAPDGKFAVLLPYHRKGAFETIANAEDYYLQEEMNVRQTEKHSFFRSMLVFGRDQEVIKREEMMIREDGEYSERFVGLLKDYYLKL